MVSLQYEPKQFAPRNHALYDHFRLPSKPAVFCASMLAQLSCFRDRVGLASWTVLKVLTLALGSVTTLMIKFQAKLGSMEGSKVIR